MENPTINGWFQWFEATPHDLGHLHVAIRRNSDCLDSGCLMDICLRGRLCTCYLLGALCLQIYFDGCAKKIGVYNSQMACQSSKDIMIKWHQPGVEWVSHSEGGFDAVKLHLKRFRLGECSAHVGRSAPTCPMVNLCLLGKLSTAADETIQKKWGD